MKCNECGFENKDKSKFCTKCGNSLIINSKVENQSSSKSNYIILSLVAIIIVLIVIIGFYSFNMSGNDDVNYNPVENESQQVNHDDDSEVVETQEVSSSKVVKSKSWKSIGSYSGSGSGSQTIEVPEGEIMIKLSAYPIKNYATNHLYVTGSNGESAGVDWGSKSAVETRSDSIKYYSPDVETFTIDYYETVSWEVEFFIYQ